jgi:carbon-monoxide dehydrogenase small subunit
MKITFRLNGKDTSVEADPSTRLIHVLRNTLGLSGMKEGCLQGQCGCCQILMNDELVPSCLVPAFAAFRGEIQTIEGFRETPEYKDIEKGFLHTGVAPCGVCAAAKVLATHVILREYPSPSEDIIRKGLSGILCRCTTPTALLAGVRSAAAFRRLRIHGR